MANPQKENGHLDIANELVDKFCLYRLSGQEWQIVWAVFRKTWCWLIDPKDKASGKKKMDYISLSQMELMTGIDRRKCHDLLKKLVTKMVLIRTVTQKGDKPVIRYGFQKNYDKWKVSPKRVSVPQKGVRVSSKRVSRVSPKRVNTKDILKDTIQKKRDLCPHDEVVKLYHTILDELPKVSDWTEPRKRKLNARWNSKITTNDGTEINSLKYWENLFNYVKDSDFLMGRKTGFIADLEWIVTKSNFVKIREAKYENRRKE